MRQVTRDRWHMTHDMWHETHDTWFGVNILSKFQLSSSKHFDIYVPVNIWKKRMTDWLNELMNDKSVCRTAPATPGLLIRHVS